MTDPTRYRPFHVTEVDEPPPYDDCRPAALLMLVDCATLGEVERKRDGRYRTARQRKALRKKMRENLGPSHAAGTLNTTDSKDMVKETWPEFPPLWTSFARTFEELWKDLQKGFVCSLSGNPGRINGQSPIKRCDFAHEICLVRATATKALVFDPMAPTRWKDKSGKRHIYKGDEVPRQDIYEFAYRVNEGDVITACHRAKVGSWTEAALIEKELRARIRKLRKQVKDLGG